MESLWARTKRTACGCLEWQGGLSTQGYGVIRVDYRTQYTHRLAFELANGYRPTQFVCHKCDNRKCIEPTHLYEGSPKDNATDAKLKGRMGRKHSLSPEVREAIRELYSAGAVTQRKLARQFRTSQATISEIIRHKHEPRGPHAITS